MSDYNKLFSYLGQLFTFYKRTTFFIDELIPIISPKTAFKELIEEFVKNEYLSPIGEGLYKINDKLSVQFSNLDSEVYKTGEIKGGEIKVDPNVKLFTVLVEFDSTLKFNNTRINYLSSEILFICEPGYLYSARINTPEEANIPVEEEKINRYLSHLSYHLNIPVTIISTHSATSDFVTKTKTNTTRNGIYVELPKLDCLSMRQYQAISFFRQYKNFSGLNTREAYYYQLLSLVKILEGINPIRDPGKQKQVVLDTIKKYKPNLNKEYQSKLSLLEKEFQSKHGLNFEEVLWERYRHGVSHWREKWFLDPDVPDNHLGSLLNILYLLVKDILVHEYNLPVS